MLGAAVRTKAILGELQKVLQLLQVLVLLVVLFGDRHDDECLHHLVGSPHGNRPSPTMQNRAARKRLHCWAMILAAAGCRSRSAVRQWILQEFLQPQFS